MSSIYKGVLTNNGKALIAQATTANRVGFSHIAIGDGNGSVPTPTDTRTALVRERHRLALNSVNINPNNRNQIICEAIIPSNVGGWTIRELGLYAGSTMLVHSNYPATYKPTQTEGGARELVIRMVINVQSADVIALTLNDSLVYATREWAETNFVNHHEVINNLTSTEINKPLSANQGKILNDNKVAKTVIITAGNGLTGGGDLSTNRSLALGTPSQITATSSNSVTAESHSHAIDKASTTVAGIVQLNDSLTSTSNTQALTANQGKILQDTKANKAGETFTGRVKATDFIAPRWRSAEPISLFRETSNDAQQLYTGGLLISNNYADNTHIPAHGIYAKGQIKTDAGFIGNLTGNSASATQLQNPRTINGVAFDGTQNITIADNTKVAKSGDSMTGSLNLLADNTMINVGNNDDIAIIKKSGLGGAIAFGANNRFRVYKSNNARVSPSDTLTQVFEVDTNGFATANKFIGTLQGNADTSTQLQTPRIINGVAFDGSQNINIEAPLMYRGNANTAEQLDNAKQTGFYLVNNNPTITNLGLYNYGVLYVYQRGDVVHQLYYAHVPNTKGSCATRITWHNDWTRSASWRIIDTPLNNTLTSTATDQALTAAQGKILNESKIDKVDVRIAKANVDVDTYKNDGNYAFFYGALNLPFSGAGKLQVISGNNGNYVTQIAYPYPSESNEVYIRSQTAYNEGFSTWKRLDGADWSDIRNKPTSLNSYSNEFIGTLRWGGTAQTAQNALPFAITQGRIQSFSSLILNADTDNSASGVEHILLSASNGLSSDTNTGLTIRSNGVKWKNGRTEIADNGDVVVRNPNGYSGLALMGTDGSYIRIESNPTLATSATSFGNLIYRNSAGTNQAVISLPRKNGMMLLATDIINAVNNSNTTAPASANAVKTAYDKAIDVEQQLNQLRSALQIQRKDYSARLIPTHNNFRTQTVNVTGSVEVLPDGRIIQRFTFTCPVIYFHRHNLSAFYREKLGVSSFAAEDSPLLELPLWTAMPNKVQEARIHLSSNLNHNAWGEALEFAYDWDSIFNQHVNIKDKAYFAFRRWGGSQDEPVTFNIVVEGY